MLVERPMLLPVKASLSSKPLSCRVIEWIQSVGVHNLERLEWRGGVEMNNVIE